MLGINSKNGDSGQAGKKPDTHFFSQIVAFPHPLKPNELIVQVVPETGIPMRDYFAAKVLSCAPYPIESSRECADWAYRVADAMIEARKPIQKPNGFPEVLD